MSAYDFDQMCKRTSYFTPEAFHYKKDSYFSILCVDFKNEPFSQSRVGEVHLVVKNNTSLIKQIEISGVESYTKEQIEYIRKWTSFPSIEVRGI